MTEQSADQLPKPQADAPALGAAVTGAMPAAGAAPTLTMVRGTRPLIISRVANGSRHGYRRRSA
ncbi:hypothetical protein MON38_07140 [Hymenobacter sp. DH14]|uniref:Uncharacterized protein n=1 Tax=Hymenobacter cyanobacteriorum TaxID=2926463 RepID=A0A9X2AEG5_9BACT|nr:hypothetical protein [Hymenobacter cyanobacteriorum]MCI1187191.1 hypothetical protein [Hymenobacter cyanobacteriorum]